MEHSGTPRKTPFVVSPIGTPGTPEHDHAGKVLKHILKATFSEQEWLVHRADESKVPDSINQHVIRSIVEADLILADLTGHNPNVFYELAVAHGFRKPVVHLISEGERIPFDVFDLRTIHYDITDLDSFEVAKAELKAYAAAAMANAGELVTRLSTYETFRNIRTMESSNNGEIVSSVLEQILQRLNTLESHLGANRPPASTHQPSPLWNTYNELKDRGFFTNDDVEHLERELLYILQQLTKQNTNERYESAMETTALAIIEETYQTARAAATKASRPAPRSCLISSQ